MSEIFRAFEIGMGLLFGWEQPLAEIVLLSLRVSGAAVILAGLVGMPLGSALAVFRFPGRRPLVALFSAMMGLPPVVVGLLVDLLLSRSGPLGDWGLLFSPTAMSIAQWLLVLPIVISLTRQVVEELWDSYREPLQSLGAGPATALWTLLWEGRFSLATALLAGFGRAIAEVGAVLIVGGNIAHHTRVMTTAIALETSRGDLALALALGMVLIALTVALNAAAYLVNEYSRHRWG